MNFSRRTAWNLEPTRLAQRQESASRARALVDLTESNPTRCGFSYPSQKLAGALTGPGWETYSPDPRGSLSARQAVEGYYRARGCSITAEEILLCSSTSEAYSSLFKLLCDPGDNVLVPNPSYPLLAYLTQLESVEARAYSLELDSEWRLDVDALESVGNDRTRAVLAVNPGNPTGSFLKRGELEGIYRLCAARGWALISDEVFSDYSLLKGEARISTVLAHSAPVLTFALSGLSKVAALPQLKLAWFCASGPPADKKNALNRLDLIMDSYLSANTLVQRALPEILELAPALQGQILQRIALNRRVLLAARPSAAPWDILSTEGGWSAVIRLPRQVDEERICLSLLEAGVVVQPGYFFDFPCKSFLVASLLPEPAPFALAVERLANVLGNCG